MRQPKKSASRRSGWLRGAIVGVRLHDYIHEVPHHIALDGECEATHGRWPKGVQAVLVRPCCVLEVRAVRTAFGARTVLCVTHQDGEVRVTTSTPMASVLRLMGEYGRTVPHGA